jgi:YbaB/EbfC DNA-binding family
MDGQDWFDDYRARLAGIGARAAAAGRGMAGVEASAASRDGAVTATVDATGVLLRLTITDGGEPLSRPQLAAAVLEAARLARAQAAREAVAAVAPLIGSGSGAMRMLRAHLQPDAGETPTERGAAR